jgi:hypothetical protein
MTPRYAKYEVFSSTTFKNSNLQYSRLNILQSTHIPEISLEFKTVLIRDLWVVDWRKKEAKNMMYCNSLFKFVRSWYFYDFKYVNEA